MAYRGQGWNVQKGQVQPINLIFRCLQNRSRIQGWLYEQVNMWTEGCTIGFDDGPCSAPFWCSHVVTSPCVAVRCCS
uniref:Uncharacterized protein n=1 Tax=Bos mutus grunniens TaxID=30521 RepID=A0A8B9XIQ9_BOSMU